MRFKIDENLPAEVAELLILAGHEAITVPAQHLTGSADSEISRVCIIEGFALITLDRDFADVRTYPPGEHPGLVVLRLDRQDKDYVLEIIPRVIQMLIEESLAGKLWIVQEDRIRIRE